MAMINDDRFGEAFTGRPEAGNVHIGIQQDMTAELRQRSATLWVSTVRPRRRVWRWMIGLYSVVALTLMVGWPELVMWSATDVSFFISKDLDIITAIYKGWRSVQRNCCAHHHTRHSRTLLQPCIAFPADGNTRRDLNSTSMGSYAQSGAQVISGLVQFVDPVPLSAAEIHHHKRNQTIGSAEHCLPYINTTREPNKQ